ncbi:MAG: PspC domain-containing protein [Bacteroidales bacterium]|nr:PspC domain-containing protein [Bacteroidales bacterium]MCF8343247.1 PspC domain-containing protein [Bacteroidales bacterium]MCF8351228.1 PspC domain-containing protein [Bacteroidales bacterium]MCF8374844.1 PspC domain-containing protein [Bacteroidales bacterium]MCF8399752.1 PspC domain-containing protein [Bacteroidales bacterium]
MRQIKKIMQKTSALYRDRTDTMIGGVAGGLGKYLNMDPTIIRIIFLILAFFGGGIILYLILWIAIPLEPIDYFEKNQYQSNMENESTDHARQTGEERQPASYNKPPSDGNLIAGVILIAIGAIFLINRFLDIDFGDLWPFILLAAGVVLVIRGFTRSN